MKYLDQNGNEVDTDKLPDLEAEIVERQHVLYNWMIEHNVPVFILSMVPKGSSDRIYASFNTSDDKNKYIQFYRALDTYLRKGGLCLYDLKGDSILFKQ